MGHLWGALSHAFDVLGFGDKVGVVSQAGRATAL
jgi:hypothetical protein